MVTRRCSQRTFRLRPSALTNQIFKYCIGLAQAKTGVAVHAACVMSNHMHLVVTDTHGLLPDFVRELDRMVAKVMNFVQGQCENLWSNDQPHYLTLGEDEDVVAKMAYAIANPVAAGLVEAPEEWPGLISWSLDDALVENIARPEAFFGKKSRCPAEVELRITPTAIPNIAERFAAHLETALTKAHRTMRLHKCKFLGARRVRKKSFVERARSLERKLGITPRIAARNMFIRRAMLDAHRHFLRDYHAALAEWRAGRRDVAFPVGTWWMRRFHGAREAGGTLRGGDVAPLARHDALN
jgi:REP element-mobilizing transposase RayT